MSRRPAAASARKKRPAAKKASRKKAAKVSKGKSKKGASKGKASKLSASKKGSKKKTVSSKKVGATKAKASKISAKKTPGRSASRATIPGKARPAASSPARRSAVAVRISNVNVLTGPSRGFKPYQPKRGEDYMSGEQLEHFRQILLAWKRELMEEVDRTMHHMKDDAANFPDPNDRATQESEFGLELRTRDRERKLLKKIDSALGRIDDGSYGYCEETGDEIGLRRLEARPVATLCVEAQERRELAERQFRDREDYYR
jgi:DnaK suppressor protein